MDNHDQALEARAQALLKSECPECGGAGYTEDDDGSVRCQTCLNDYDVNKAQAIRAIVAALREARVPDANLHCMCDVYRALDISKKLSEAPDEIFSKERANKAFASLIPRAKDGRP